MKSKLGVSIAHSTELDSLLAVNELIAESKIQLAGQQPSAGILFAGIDVDHQLVLDILFQQWPDLQLIGATADGEFSSECEYVEDSLVLTLFTSEDIVIASGYINNLSQDLDQECTSTLNAAELRMGQPSKLCILLSDVLKINGETIMEKLTRASEGRLPIIGGISADSWRFCETRQFCNCVSSSTISSFLLFAGDFEFSYGMDIGWEPVGETGIVTKSDSNIVYEINNRPALEFYTDILGEYTKPSLELPIAVYDSHNQFLYMRTTFENYDIQSGSITYLGNVPSGSRVRITLVNRDSILAGTQKSLQYALSNFPPDSVPCVALCFSCSARRVLLGTRTSEECLLVSKTLGRDAKFAGLYTYGEYCPKLFERTNEFHNETFVVLLIG